MVEINVEIQNLGSSTEGRVVEIAAVIAHLGERIDNARAADLVVEDKVALWPLWRITTLRNG